MDAKEFKHILRDGEQEYQADAWTNMQKRLDQALPVKKNPFSGSTANLIYIASALLIGSGVYFLLPKSESETPKVAGNSSSKEQQTKGSEQNSEKTPDSKTKTITGDELTETKKEDGSKPEKQPIDQDQAFELINPFGSNSDSRQPNENSNLKEVKEQEAIIEFTEVKFILPKVNISYCLGQHVKIPNKNKNSLELILENQPVAVIEGNASEEIALNTAGNYFFRYEVISRNGSEVKTESAFQVQPATELNISSEQDVNYENGLPYIQLSSIDFNGNAVWSSSKGQVLDQAQETKLRTFEKGTYTVTLTKTDENQCKSVGTAKIKVDETYNLLAVEAFIPSHSDTRKNRFMPDALKYRNTPFKLIILDPRDNHVVFRSTSVENSWDGTDETTGQAVDAFKLYIWKVELKNPEPGEKPEYSGTVLKQ